MIVWVDGSVRGWYITIVDAGYHIKVHESKACQSLFVIRTSMQNQRRDLAFLLIFSKSAREKLIVRAFSRFEGTGACE